MQSLCRAQKFNSNGLQQSINFVKFLDNNDKCARAKLKSLWKKDLVNA